MNAQSLADRLRASAGLGVGLSAQSQAVSPQPAAAVAAPAMSAADSAARWRAAASLPAVADEYATPVQSGSVQFAQSPDVATEQARVSDSFLLRSKVAPPPASASKRQASCLRSGDESVVASAAEASRPPVPAQPVFGQAVRPADASKRQRVATPAPEGKPPAPAPTPASIKADAVREKAEKLLAVLPPDWVMASAAAGDEAAQREHRVDVVSRNGGKTGAQNDAARLLVEKVRAWLYALPPVDGKLPDVPVLVSCSGSSTEAPFFMRPQDLSAFYAWLASEHPSASRKAAATVDYIMQLRSSPTLALAPAGPRKAVGTGAREAVRPVHIVLIERAFVRALPFDSTLSDDDDAGVLALAKSDPPSPFSYTLCKMLAVGYSVARGGDIFDAKWVPPPPGTDGIVASVASVLGIPAFSTVSFTTRCDKPNRAEVVHTFPVLGAEVEASLLLEAFDRCVSARIGGKHAGLTGAAFSAAKGAADSALRASGWVDGSLAAAPPLALKQFEHKERAVMTQALSDVTGLSLKELAAAKLSGSHIYRHVVELVADLGWSDEEICWLGDWAAAQVREKATSGAANKKGKHTRSASKSYTPRYTARQHIYARARLQLLMRDAIECAGGFDAIGDVESWSDLIVIAAAGGFDRAAFGPASASTKEALTK